MAERPAPVARLLGEIHALDGVAAPGHQGRSSAARRAELVDACLRALFEAAQPPPHVALVALGGYGRAELLPASDIDLLILHDGSDPDGVATLAGRVLYPLWDAGLSVGHGVRTAGESRELARSRLDAATAMLDGRALAGDVRAWTRLRDGLLEELRADIAGFADRLRSDVEARRERFGATSSLLEPDLKEGVGGLRDVQVLGWLAVVLGRTLETEGLVRAAEREAVEAAAEFLVRVRSALQLQTGRAGDRLLLELQPTVAAGLGFQDEPGLLAVDALMRRVFEHARQVEYVREAALDRYLGDATDAPAVDPTPVGVLRSLAGLGRTGGALPAATLDAIGAVPVPAPVPWGADVRDAFLALLRTGDVRALHTLDRLGLLERYLPAWTGVRARPQRDPYHRYPVDVHLLEASAAMARLLEDPGEDPMAARALDVVVDRDALLLGALLHDIGKVGQGEHVRAGERIAREALDAMALPEGTRNLALFMVIEHLLLSDTATRRDLQDDDLIDDVATRVGDPERLAALYLLTIADAAATGPLAWTPWRATLVRELVAKVQHVLERGEIGADTAGRLAKAFGDLRLVVEAVDPEEIDRFVARMPHAYLLSASPERIAREYPLLASAVRATEVRTVAGPGPRPGTYELTVVASDRPGLLATIAGALTLSNLSILSAQVFTSEDGVAVDRFDVEGAYEVVVTEERWEAFGSTLRTAIEGRLALADRVQEKRRAYPVTRRGVPVRVSVDHEASDLFTVVEVGAPDRVGLLFDITRTLADLGLDVHLAKVATYGSRVVDAFYVRDDLGRRLEDPARVRELERTLRARIEA